MDIECNALCDAINLIQGIYTISSCCGHGKDKYRIWLEAESLAVLPNLLYWFDSCHCGFYQWRVIARTDCGKGPAIFMIEGPVGAYEEANIIAALIIDDQANL
jgi:hypothetical protein